MLPIIFTWEDRMTIDRTFSWALAAFVATAINTSILIVNLSTASRAAVDGKNTQALISDPDFKSAVQAIVEACHLNADLGKLRCP
jgi:hypothetical protein